MWNANTGEYRAEDGSINGVLRLGKVDRAYIQRTSFLLRKILQPTNHDHHIGGRTVQPGTTLFLRQDSQSLAVLSEVAGENLQLYLAGVRCQRDNPVVTALYPILIFVEYHDDGIFPLLLDSPPIQIQKTSSLGRRAGSPFYRSNYNSV